MERSTTERHDTKLGQARPSRGKDCLFFSHRTPEPQGQAGIWVQKTQCFVTQRTPLKSNKPSYPSDGFCGHFSGEQWGTQRDLLPGRQTHARCLPSPGSTTAGLTSQSTGTSTALEWTQWGGQGLKSTLTRPRSQPGARPSGFTIALHLYQLTP